MTADATAGIEGTLILDDLGCVHLGTTEDVTPLVWPRGYTARRVGDQVEVLSPDGVVAGRTGSSFSAGGDIFTTTDLGDQRCLRPGVKTFWVANPLGHNQASSGANASQSDDSSVAPVVPADDASVAHDLISLLQEFAEANPTQRSGVTAESDGVFPVAVQVHLPRGQVLTAKELEAVAGLRALGVSVTVEQRDWSSAELNTLLEDVLASDLFAPYGGLYEVVTRYGVNQRTNRVEFGVKHSQPELAAEGTRRFGEGLTIVFDDRQLIPG